MSTQAPNETELAINPARHTNVPDAPAVQSETRPNPPALKPPVLPTEIGGAPGPEPTRYGDWQHKGRCTDF